MFGAAVINQVAFQWNQLGLVIDDTSTIGGGDADLHHHRQRMSIMIVGRVGAPACLRRLPGSGQQRHERPHRRQIASAAVFWYAMVGLYFIIWILIFITK